jgi:hypothetical protein
VTNQRPRGSGCLHSETVLNNATLKIENLRLVVRISSDPVNAMQNRAKAQIAPLDRYDASPRHRSGPSLARPQAADRLKVEEVLSAL